MAQNIRTRLSLGETCIGGWLSVSSPQVAEAMASCGFDWVSLDLEHSLFSLADIHACFVAIERHGAAPFCRMPCADPFFARQLLDAGAQGLIIPVVEDAQSFSDFADHCHYPPYGKRGVGVSRQMMWGDAFETYMDDFLPFLVPQIETQKGVDAAEKLASMPNVSSLFIGPYDLSASLGAAGEFDSDEFATAVEIVRQACEKNNKPAGYHQVDPDKTLLRQKVDAGYRFVAFGTDMFAMRMAFDGIERIARGT
jgi:2-keto-3-deoxy-L-rhamnonate aldolase RhmA